MLFVIGIEKPKTDQEAYGIVVPAFNDAGYGCFSAADTESEILAQAKDAILSMAEEMAEDGIPMERLKSERIDYRDDPDYGQVDQWLAFEVDLSAIGKQQRVNISLSAGLLARIDSFVQRSGKFRDRSHFLAVAADHEMVHSN